MWPRLPKIWFVISGFCYNGVRYLGFLPIQNTLILPGPKFKKTHFVLTGTSLYRGSTVYWTPAK